MSTSFYTPTGNRVGMTVRIFLALHEMERDLVSHGRAVLATDTPTRPVSQTAGIAYPFYNYPDYAEKAQLIIEELDLVEENNSHDRIINFFRRMAREKAIRYNWTLNNINTKWRQAYAAVNKLKPPPDKIIRNNVGGNFPTIAMHDAIMIILAVILIYGGT